jgi:hypothetical protein
MGKEELVISVITLVVTTGSLGVAAAALVVAFRIPRSIMAFQIYADLLREYRSSEMGAAILSVCQFYKENKGKSEDEFATKYKEIYRKQIGDKLEKIYNKQMESNLEDNKQKKTSPEDEKPIDYAHTLHFQRRLIAQFYSDFAALRYKPYFPEELAMEQLQNWFTPREVNLLAIILRMDKPAENVFEEVGYVTPPEKKSTVSMNKLIDDLYNEVKQWQNSKGDKGRVEKAKARRKSLKEKHKPFNKCRIND